MADNEAPEESEGVTDHEKTAEWEAALAKKYPHLGYKAPDEDEAADE